MVLADCWRIRDSLTTVRMKLKKEIINARAIRASQWQLQIRKIQSNYGCITDLLTNGRALSPNITGYGQELQQQLIRLLAQFVADMDELEENTAASDNDTQTLFNNHIQQMRELNERIHTFLSSLPPEPVS